MPWDSSFSSASSYRARTGILLPLLTGSTQSSGRTRVLGDLWEACGRDEHNREPRMPRRAGEASGGGKQELFKVKDGGSKSSPGK